MIFSNGLDDKVRDGSKTQTRRLVKEDDYTWRNALSLEISSVCDQYNRLKWKVGKTYAIQSGRGKKGDGRFRITKIRKERLQDISEEDCRAEGIIVPPAHGRFVCVIEGQTSSRYIMPSPIPYFAELWNSIHKKKDTRWEDNPLVWVLELENVGRD